MAAPWGIELDNLDQVLVSVFCKEGRQHTDVWLDCAMSESYVFAVAWRTGEFLLYMALTLKQARASTAQVTRNERAILTAIGRQQAV